MALAATCTWEIRDTGSILNGGFYNAATGTNDYSQQPTAQYPLTGCTSAAANAIILNANAAADMVGNGACVVSGTNATAGNYEVISVVVGVSITVDRNWCTAAAAAGVVNIGGAKNLNNNSTETLIDDVVVAGNTLWIKKGAYSLGASLTFANGGATANVKFLGYNATRGDSPTGTDRPSISHGARTYTTGSDNLFANLICFGTSNGLINVGTRSRVINCKFTNTSLVAGQRALTMAADAAAIDCEAASTLGVGINASTASGHVLIQGCNIHDSDVGIALATAIGTFCVADNIVESCTTAALNMTAVNTVQCAIIGNTLYGAETPIGIGLNIAAGAGYGLNFINNIVYGFVTGVSHATASQVLGYSNYNNFYNNTTNRTNWSTGPQDSAVDPQFSDAPNGDFRVGVNSQATGFPSSFQGGLSIGYRDTGAVQRKEDYPLVGVVLTGSGVYGNGGYTPTLALPTALEIADAVWDEAIAGHVAAGSFGQWIQKLLKKTTFLGLK